MPQLMIDTNTENAVTLRLTAEFIQILAKEKENGIVSEELRDKNPAQLFGHNSPPPSAVVQSVPAGTAPPPPPPTPSAAMAPAASTASTTISDSPIDNTGAAHDPALHSTPAKMNADGTWRARRGLGKINPISSVATAAPASTMAQAAAATATAIAPPPPTTAPTMTSPSNVAPPPPNNVVSLHPPVAPPPPPSGATGLLPGNGEVVSDVRTLMKAVTPLLVDKRLDNTGFDRILAANGTNLNGLANAPALCAKVWGDIKLVCGVA